MAKTGWKLGCKVAKGTMSELQVRSGASEVWFDGGTWGPEAKLFDTVGDLLAALAQFVIDHGPMPEENRDLYFIVGPAPLGFDLGPNDA